MEETMRWEDERNLTFDPTVMMGHGWDSFGWEHLREEVTTPRGEVYAVWPEGHGAARRWSAYGGSLGLMRYCGFTSEEEAKATVARWATTSPATGAEGGEDGDE